MMRSGFQSVLVFVATCAFGLTASVVMADKGGKGGGHGGGHHGGGHHGGHGHHSSHAHHGHGNHSGHSSHRYGSGHHYGGSRYGSGLSGFGFSRGGISLSIGGGNPYGYGGYGGYGSRGYGYGGYGSSHVGIPVYGLSRSIYSPYGSYGHTPYYPGRSSSWLGYTPQPSYGYRYDRVPATNYVVPDSSRQYSQTAPSTRVAPVEQLYSAAKPVSPSDDLQPGMVLPDGSTVVSVGPLDSEPQTEPSEGTVIDRTSEIQEPSEIEPVPLDQDSEELESPTDADPDPDSTSL